MIGNIKALIVVIAIAAMVFHLAKQLALQFMTVEDFSRRRNVWFALTVTCFLVPNLWLYAAVAVPVLVTASRKESNLLALYVWMLHVVPPMQVIIPLFGTSGLLPLDNNRILEVCILLPAAMRERRFPSAIITNQARLMTFLLFGFGFLQVILYAPPDIPHQPMVQDTLLNIVRRILMFALDTYLLYFTASRTCKTREQIMEVAASICMGCAVLAAIAIFENLRGWLLYTDIASRWGNDPHAAFYLTRGGSVRAQVSVGHSIALGNILAVGFSFWLYLRTHVQTVKHRIGTTLLLIGGLYATSSRGAWLGAAFAYFTFLATGPHAASRLIKGSVFASIAAGAVTLSPLGNRIIEMLPEKGQPADLYRHRLAARGWELVMAHPLFGDRFPWPEMEDLRQGEGIIDMVNTYLAVALNYGFIGLLCFLGFILVGIQNTYVCARSLVRLDPDFSLLGTSLIASITSILLMIEYNSFALGCEKLFFLLAGLSVAYVSISQSQLLTPLMLDTNQTRRT